MRPTHPERFPATNTRPVLHMPRSGLEWAVEALALLGVVLTVALPAFFWDRLPDRVPTHFGFSGQPDAWGPKAWIWAVPAVSVALYLGLSWLARFPHRLNYPWPITPENAPAQYRCARWLLLSLKAVIGWTFAWIVWGTIQTSLGNASGLGQAFLPLTVGAIAGILGLYFVKSYRQR